MDKSEVIDVSALEKELHRVLEADRKHERENEAKFRAIQQKVSTYEEFRDIVLASHLKPLDKKDKRDSTRKQSWNSISAGNKEQKATREDTEQPLQTVFSPSSASEFARDWRRLRGGPGEKYSLLMGLGGEKLRELFGAGAGAGPGPLLLGEVLSVLSQALRPQDAEVVLGLLEGLTQTGRFSLNISLLSEEERQACRHLLHTLQHTLQHTQSHTQTLQGLMVKYGCSSEF